MKVFDDKFTRNGTVLVVVHPGVSRRFPTVERANTFIRYYEMMEGKK